MRRIIQSQTAINDNKFDFDYSSTQPVIGNDGIVSIVFWIAVRLFVCVWAEPNLIELNESTEPARYSTYTRQLLAASC